MRSTALLTFLLVSIATGLTMADTDEHSELSTDTIALFSEIQKIAEDMQSNADSLPTTYLSFQGPPLSNADYHLPDIKIENLPTAAMDYDTFLSQTDETRLKNNLYFYSAIVEFLQIVKTEQEDLNPFALDLTAKLEEAVANSNTLISKISAIMTQMGMSETIEFPDPLVVPFKGTAYFQKKLRGGVICKEFKERVDLTKRDFEFFAKKYEGHL
uniref:Receptivity factor PRFA1 n=1 Tax=Plethodon dorsalis TaxID=255923 RepID=Q5BNZ0_9SALA|nr:receptivity factor PRFA1 [Plethodon dorsalis]